MNVKDTFVVRLRLPHGIGKNFVGFSDTGTPMDNLHVLGTLIEKREEIETRSSDIQPQSGLIRKPAVRHGNGDDISQFDGSPIHSMNQIDAFIFPQNFGSCTYNRNG